MTTIVSRTDKHLRLRFLHARNKKGKPCKKCEGTGFFRADGLTQLMPSIRDEVRTFCRATFTSLLEALNNFWDIIRVDMAQAELAILVVLTNSVNMPLTANKEAKVVATRYSFYLNCFAEWHLDRVAHFLTMHGERPGE